MDTRPTSDRLRETLFNVLAPRMEGAAFLDLYAGSGAVGIEALSRGAAHVVLVEKAAPALKVLKANLARLGIRGSADVHSGAVGTFLRREGAREFDVVFLDPPYEASGEYSSALGLLGGAAAGLLRPEAIVVAEHRKKDALGEKYGRLVRTRVLQQGDAALSWYALAEEQV
jgi:16S rRNA (guanine(966)-N(2))-methyltransferase RsmD